jgi:hypothetical protein
MNATRTLTLSLAIAALSAGCASSGPNTRQGAAGGAIAGGVLGAIVGHQSGEGVAGAAIGAAAGGAAGAALGNRADRDRGTLDRGPSNVDRGYGYAVAAPPPMPTSNPREAIPARPAREAVWIEGQWIYTGNPNSPYEWMSGHWEIPPRGARTYVPGNWQHNGNGYVYVRGHWQ